MHFPSKTPIPYEVQAPDRDIEWMLWRLLKNSQDTQRQSDFAHRKEVAAWTFILMVGVISLLDLYILYMKTRG